MAKEKREPLNLVATLKSGLVRKDGEHPVERMTSYRQGDLLQIPVGELSPNPNQPREHFDEQELRDLTDSVREKGVLQPIVALYTEGKPGFTIVAGERRWRASKAAGLTKIPAIVRTDADMAEVALIENVQRQNLTPLEEAKALARLKEEKGYTDAALAKVIGKSRPTVVQTLSLLKIPLDLQETLLAGQHFSKTVVLQAFSQGGAEKLRAVLAGEAPVTRAQLRSEKKAAKGGRPKHFRHVVKDEETGGKITFELPKSSAEEHELVAMLDRVRAHLKPRAARKSA